MPKRRAMIISGADFGPAGLGPHKELWTPLELGSNLLMWLYPTDLASMTIAGTDVTAMTSKDSSAFVFTNQSGGAVKPQYDATAFNGKPGLTFSPSTGGLTGSVLQGTGPLNDAGMMGFATVKRTAQLDGAGIAVRPIMSAPVALVSAIRQNAYVTFWRPTADAPQTLVSAGQHTGLPNSDSSLAAFGLNESRLVQGEFSNAAPLCQVRVDGAVNPGLPAGYFNVAATKYFVGGANNANDGQTGFILHQALWTKPLDQTTRQKVEGYMAWTAGLQANLPASHPYKHNGPFAA